MLARSRLTRFFSEQPKGISSRMASLEERISKVVPKTSAYIAGREMGERRQKTMDEKLAELDSKVAKIEALRQAGKPIEDKFRNMEMKYGRTGRHPAYPWHGQAVPYEDRIPHLADRIGSYSKAAPGENTMYDMLELNSDLNNPSFKSHFVQEPSREPDPDVNFEKGEILYENKDALQGVKLARQLGYTSFGYMSFYMAHTLITGRSVYPIADEFADVRADVVDRGDNWFSSVFQAGSMWHDLETLGIYAFAAPLLPLLGMSYLMLIKQASSGIVTKMQFNAEKDLLFISKAEGSFFIYEEEEVYEVAHLQVLPPTPRTGLDNAEHGTYFTLSCMNTQENMILKKDPKYWNPELYKDFKNHIYYLWT